MLRDISKLLLIAGPCMLESESLCREVARELAELRGRNPELQIVFKGSFDKANRTSLDSPRGPGLEAGMELLKRVKEETGLPVLTDIHLPDQAAPAGKVCDVLQIPAFLCRQTDLLAAAAKTGRGVNVKKGQFLSPAEMEYVVGKLEGSGAAEIWLTERGTTFGYQNLVVDMRNIPEMGRWHHAVILDATHAVQSPGAGGGVTSGDRSMVSTLARAGIAAGADGLFVETHPDPDCALSDGPNQIPLAELPDLVEDCLKIWKVLR